MFVKEKVEVVWEHVYERTAGFHTTYMTLDLQIVVKGGEVFGARVGYDLATMFSLGSLANYWAVCLLQTEVGPRDRAMLITQKDSDYHVLFEVRDKSGMRSFRPKQVENLHVVSLTKQSFQLLVID